MLQPPSNTSGSPHSGQVGFVVRSSPDSLSSWQLSVITLVSLSSKNKLSSTSDPSNKLSLILLHNSSMAYPIADGQDVPIDVSPFCIFLALYAGQEWTFLSCLITSLICMPPRNASEINLDIASRLRAHFYTLSFEIL